MDLNIPLITELDINNDTINEPEITDQVRPSEFCSMDLFWVYNYFPNIHIRDNGSYIRKVDDKYFIKYKNDDFIYSKSIVPIKEQVQKGKFLRKYISPFYISDNKISIKIYSKICIFISCFVLKNNKCEKKLPLTQVYYSCNGINTFIPLNRIKFINQNFYEGFIIPVNITFDQYYKHKNNVIKHLKSSPKVFNIIFDGDVLFEDLSIMELSIPDNLTNL